MLLAEEALNIDTTEHFDWVAIIMFYGAVHLVEKHLARREIHPKTHPERNRDTRSLKRGPRIHSNLTLLYNASLDARYRNIFLSSDDIKELAYVYEDIKCILGA
ncbi:MAG: hypothetical protein M0021_10995 [Clostridia bacterium]|nr:hypothetical protein [Clostridia bacterium]